MNSFKLPAVTFVVLAIGATPANAQKYDVRHDFKLLLNPRPNQPFRGAWNWSTQARAASRIDGVASATNNGAFIGWVPPVNVLSSALAVRNGASAFATSELNVLANGAGFHRVTGIANVFAPNGISARASSSSALNLGLWAVNRQGRIVWRPIWFVDAISGSAARAKDPVDISILNLDNGDIQNTSLWDTSIEFSGIGSSSWANGNLNINGATGSFFLNMDSPFLTSGTGTMSLTFVDGFVTASNDQGVFDGLLPAVGASSFGINIPIGDNNGDINLDFNFGPDNTNGFDIGVGLGSSGSLQAVPEPATLAALSFALCFLKSRRKRLVG